MKIIHLSDLHLGWIDRETKAGTIERFEKIINRIISIKKPARDYVIVITGDLVNNANKKDLYITAKKHISILKKAGFKVLIIPGNHDYGTGTLGNEKFVKIFKETFFENAEVEYPKIDIIGKNLFIGLDSMAEELHVYDKLFADGELGVKQLSRLKDILNNKISSKHKKVVYLHHHPFHPHPAHQLKDAKKLKDVIFGKIDVLLFGHNHKGYNLNGSWNIARCYDAGSSTRKQNTPANIRVIDLDKNPVYDYVMEIITETDLEM